MAIRIATASPTVTRSTFLSAIMESLTCKDVTSADQCTQYYVFLRCQPPPLSECYFANCVWSQGACDMEGTCQGGEARLTLRPTPPAPTHAPTHAPTAPSATPTPAPTPNPTAAPTPAPTQYCDHAGVFCDNAEKWTSDPSSNKSYGDQAAAWAGGIGFCDADPACKGVANSPEWKGGKQVQYCMGEDLGLGSNAAWTVKEKTNLPSGSQCPTAAPSANPTPAPTPAPAPAPTRAPTIAPTPAPTLAPTPTPTPAPTTPAPTPAPTPIGPFTGANACTEWLAAKQAEREEGGPATAPLCEANPPGANTPPGEVASACYGCDARKKLCCDWQHMEWDAWGVQHGKSLARGSVNDGTMAAARGAVARARGAARAARVAGGAGGERRREERRRASTCSTRPQLCVRLDQLVVSRAAIIDWEFRHCGVCTPININGHTHTGRHAHTGHASGVMLTRHARSAGHLPVL